MNDYRGLSPKYPQNATIFPACPHSFFQAKAMTEPHDQPQDPTRCDAPALKSQRLTNIVFYGVAGFVIFLAMTGSIGFNLSLPSAVLASLLVWWCILMWFWSSPAFCHFEQEHGWWEKIRGMRQSISKIILAALWWLLFWPIQVPKRIYLWLLIIAACMLWVAQV